MKTKILLTVLLTLSFSFVNQVSGQGSLLKGVMNKAQQKVEQKIEKKVMEQVDKEIDKGLDKIEESMEKNKQETDSTGFSNSKKSNDQKSQDRMSRLMKGIGLGGEPIPIADSYSFTQLIQMKVESFDGSGQKVSSGDFITLMNTELENMAYESISDDATSGEGIFIIDTKNKATIMLSDENGSKTGIVYGFGAMNFSSELAGTETIEDTPEYYAAHPNVKKTGKTKKVAGYTCEQFIISDEDVEGDVWITRDLKVKTNDFFSTIFKVEMASAGMGWGYMMESTSVKKSTGEKSVITVTKVDPKANRKFNLSDYSITNMGNIAIPSE